MKSQLINRRNEQAIALIGAGLRALASRLIPVLLAFTGLFGAFFLWNKILQDPTINQLIGMSLFAAFVLGLLIVEGMHDAGKK
jgi:hypothetical protein